MIGLLSIDDSISVGLDAVYVLENSRSQRDHRADRAREHITDAATYWYGL
jgi:hypothetical protein